MKILYICNNCQSQVEGILVKTTDYVNTTNMDMLFVCCDYCGNLLAKMFTERSFPEEKQREIWRKYNEKHINTKTYKER